MSESKIKGVDDYIGEESFLKIIPAKDKIKITGSALVLTKKTDKGISCYMPGFDIYFFAKDETTRKQKSLTFIKFYLDHFLVHSDKNRLRRLVLNLNKRGFRADNHNIVMPKLVNNKSVPANFRIYKSNVPDGFAGADISSDTFEMAA